jgi:hypothetical protein
MYLFLRQKFRAKADDTSLCSISKICLTHFGT